MKVSFRTIVATTILSAAINPALADEYKGAPRTFLFNPSADICFKDAAKFKKAGPYTIGFSNAGLGDSWRVVALDSMKKAAGEHKDLIKHLLITDAGHDDAKQIADIQDLVSRGVDLLIVSANTEKALDPAVTRAMKRGIPVVMVDRRISSDNFVTFVTASDQLEGRLWAQWISEKLRGKGNVIILGGQAGSSPNEARVRAGMQVFEQYPNIKILDTVYSDWSPVKGKQVMQAVIAKYGKQIDAVFSTHGLQTPGSIEAFVEAGYKAGEIPPHTSADVNGALQMALKYKVPDLEVGYPPAMYALAIETALKVLSGAKVACTTQINAQIGLTHGDETPSVPHPDQYIDKMVISDGPADMLVTGGMGQGYDPKTYKANYNQ